MPAPDAGPAIDLAGSVQYLKGVGPRRAAALAERGIVTVEDLLHHLPVRYEDRGRFTPLSGVRAGDVVTADARVVQSVLQRTRRRGFSIVASLIRDESASLRTVFFNRPYLAERLAAGTRAIFHGRVQVDQRTGNLQLANPDFEILADGEEPEAHLGLVPIHPKLPGFTPRGLRQVLLRVLAELPEGLPPTLPPGVEERLGLLPRRDALADVHFPPRGSDRDLHERRASEAHRRLIVDELFAMQLAFLARRRREGRRPDARRYDTSRAVGDRLRELLPFRLTPGQRAAFREVVADLEGPLPMARLLQGDVGSGKTIVALLAMLLAAESGHQAALMAPTGILAEQHARNFRALLGGRREVGLLTGSLGAAERRDLLAELESGRLRLVVGTHALIQERVRFSHLALAVVDEQHRFGVVQRVQLAAKADRPDVLVMTATPIPRTLALALHGDLDVTTIPDRPPGRRPVRTVVRPESARRRVVQFLDDQLAAGRQAYVVHPVIEETEEADVRAATEGADALQRLLPRRRVALLHGRMRTEQREEVMRRFAGGEVDALVATTVVEVGVDVPNATVMIVENAERFGIAQLHQLRGRVGRGGHSSWCILLAGARPTEEGRRRLALLAATDDGFLLAEEDLAQRGAGELFGERQTGLRDLRVADPVRDRELLEAARAEARRFLDSLDDRGIEQDPLIAAAEQRWRPAVERSVAG
jgi:ATP-dependent DNA helicase RecG